jgi:hypothetical protein
MHSRLDAWNLLLVQAGEFAVLELAASQVAFDADRGSQDA